MREKCQYLLSRNKPSSGRDHRRSGPSPKSLRIAAELCPSGLYQPLLALKVSAVTLLMLQLCKKPARLVLNKQHADRPVL